MLRFLWNSSRGYRLRPWESPYLRWRIETYSGIPAESITNTAFFQFVWKERQVRLVQYSEMGQEFPSAETKGLFSLALFAIPAAGRRPGRPNSRVALLRASVTV